MLDDQAMFAEMSPSSVSVAVPVNVTELPSVSLELSAGAVMVTTGESLETSPVPWMSNVKGLSSGSSFAIDTVADRTPSADGVNVIENVVCPLAETGVLGICETEKSPECVPVISTLGVPVNARSVVPVLEIVQDWRATLLTVP
jgi:hypothetical protein